MLTRLTIDRRLMVLVAMPLVGLLLVVLLAGRSLGQGRVGGDDYRAIMQRKDLVDELQPPPFQLIEADLTVEQLAAEVTGTALPAALTEHKARLGELERRYNDRLLSWQQQLAEGTPAEDRRLFDELATAGQDFWRIYHDEFLAAVDGVIATTGGSGAQVPAERRKQVLGPLERALADIDAAFTVHQQKMAALLTSTRADLDTLEAAAARQAGAQRRELALVALTALFVTGIAGTLLARSITRPLHALTEATEPLPDLLRSVQELPAGAELPDPAPLDQHGGGTIDELAARFDALQRATIRLANDEAALRANVAAVFSNLGHRNRTLLNRALGMVNVLEQGESDPELLSDLYRLDHLVTRMRRNAESLLVLAGTAPSHDWDQPVEMHDIVVGALSEIEAYDRVEVRRVDLSQVPGRVAADLSHLLAELIENATTFSPPSAAVEITGRFLHDGYLLSVADRGIGMTPAELQVANELLARPSDYAAAPGLVLGLPAVSSLAHRHGIIARLDAGTGGGVIALVTLPLALLAGAHDQHPSPPAAVEPESSLPTERSATPTGAVPVGEGAYASAAGSAAPAPAAPAPTIVAVRPDEPAEPLQQRVPDHHATAPYATAGVPAEPAERSPDAVRASWSAFQQGQFLAAREAAFPRHGDE